jgi:hypothetical protein
MTGMRPILANSCAFAATAEEARFRINGVIGGRAALVVALDDEAAEVVERVAERPWNGARFVRSGDPGLAEQLLEADVAIMIATAAADAAAAAEIAQTCTQRGIMTAGLVLGAPADVGATVSALRPYARNLMVTDDEDDVAAVLTALRA